MEEDIPFKLFANCILVKGVSRSTICDLQRNRVHPIPNILYDLLTDPQWDTIRSVKQYYGTEHEHVINEYFEFLYQEELIYFTSIPHLFPAMDLQWDSPLLITNAILDFDVNVSYDLAAVLGQLNDLNCKQVQLRCYQRVSVDFFLDVLQHLKESVLTSVEIVTGFDPNTSLDQWSDLCDKHIRITSLILHSAMENIELASPQFLTPINMVTKVIDGPQCCGVVNEAYFISYTETFTESIHFNSCLNRKISVDTAGNIRNCPSMGASFGNVANTSLAQAILESGFKKYWSINKDQIKVCKDCEFRHVCTDCRAYLEDPEDDYSKPLKCGYDPFTCEWEEWSTHPLKLNGISTYKILP